MDITDVQLLVAQARCEADNPAFRVGLSIQDMFRLPKANYQFFPQAYFPV
jgi:hypothetical protein